MNRHAQIRKMQTCISQPRKERGVFCHADREWVLNIPPSIPSPGSRSFAWQDSGNDTGHWRVWFTHSLLLQPGKWQATEYGFAAVRWHGHPSIDALLASVSIERQFSRIFPAHLRSLARCWSRARRHSAFCFVRCGERPPGFRFQQKSFAHKTHKTFFPEPRKKHAHGLGSGAHSRRFAQECPGGNPGKYKQEE